MDSSRLVVFANPALLDPETLTESNLDLVSNTLNWLLNREQLLGIPPKHRHLFRIDLPAAERSRIFWISSGVLMV